MTKPIFAALGAFVGPVVGVFAVNYFKEESFNYTMALTFGLCMAVAMYILAQLKERKEESSSDTDDSKSS